MKRLAPPQPKMRGPDRHLIRSTAEKNCDFFQRCAPRNFHSQAIVVNVRPPGNRSGSFAMFTDSSRLRFCGKAGCRIETKTNLGFQTNL